MDDQRWPRPGWRLGVFIFVVAVWGMAQPAGSAPAGRPLTACAAAYTVTSDWGNGFIATLEITHLGSDPINGWTLTWNFPGDQIITSLWNGIVSQTGSEVSVLNESWNGFLAPGQSVTLGFEAAYNVANPDPTAFSLNGVACAVGSLPTSTPWPLPTPTPAGVVEVRARRLPGTDDVTLELAIFNHAPWAIVDWNLSFATDYLLTDVEGAVWLDDIGPIYSVGGTAGQETIGPGQSVSFQLLGPAQPHWPLRQCRLNGIACVWNGESSAPPPPTPTPTPTPSPTPGPTPVPPPSWPARVFAPYVDATGWPPFDLVGVAQTIGVRFYTLGFIVGEAATCTPSWGGYYPADGGYLATEIGALRGLGGDVMPSFGGAANTELAVACSSAAATQAAYQAVIDAYDLTHLDFDIEGAWLAHPASIARRSEAIAGLQADAAATGRELHIWFTLPVLPDGLTPDGLNILSSALTYGVEIAGVNIMAMNYGDAVAPDPEGQMGAYAIQAATSLWGQLDALYTQFGIPKSDEELWEMVGVTPMIGLNDVTTEVFYPADAAQLVTFAQANHIGLLSFWSANRDKECPEGEVDYVSPTCSSILQAPFEFSLLFLPFTP